MAEKLVPVRKVGETQISLRPSDGMFVADVKSTTIQRKSLEEVEAAIERAESGISAIVIGRGNIPRNVIVVGKTEGRGVKLMDSSYINPKMIYQFNEGIWTRLSQLQVDREKAEEAYNNAIDAYSSGLKATLEEADELDAAGLKEIEATTRGTAVDSTTPAE